VDTFRVKSLLPLLRVLPELVRTVNNHISFLQVRLQTVNCLITYATVWDTEDEVFWRIAIGEAFTKLFVVLLMDDLLICFNLLGFFL